jgi:hypothetical protein
MDHDKLRTDVLTELERLKAYTTLAESYDDWYEIGTKLCNLDTKIDKVLRPDLYDEL